MDIKFLATILGKLSFGATLGAGLGGVVWLAAVGATASTGFVPVMVIGGLLGTAAWQPIDYAWRFFTGPLTRQIRRAEQVAAINDFEVKRWISPSKAEQLRAGLLAKEIEVALQLAPAPVQKLLPRPRKRRR